MAIKPCNLVLKNMNEKESSNSSEASTPEEYLTPSGESAFLSDTSAFSFPDLDSQHVRPLDSSAAAKLSDEVDNRNSINLDENLNQSNLKCSSVIIKPVLDSVDASSMNNNLDKHFQALESDIETKPTKLKPEKHLQPLVKTTKEAAGDGDLANVRKKLEERRRKMEMEKRRQELQWCQQRQAISKEAYSALFGAEADSEFHLSPDDRTKSLWNGKDGGKGQSSGYYRQDSAVAMEKLFANEELTDAQLAGGTLDRNFLKKQKSAREAGCNQPGRSTLDRKKTSSFKEASGRTKNAENSHGVDPNYGLSLDRLNSSLSELQGEIMRLSLQQDHIKNLVSLGDSPSHSSSVPTAHRAHGQGHVSSRQDPPISARSVEESVRNGAGSSQGFAGESGKGNQSARNSAFRRYSESRSYPRMGHEETFEREYLADRAYHDDLEEHLLNQQGNIPFAHPAVIPSVSPYPFLHPFHPPPYYPYAMNPYFHPYPVQPHYSLRSRPLARNLDYRTRDGQLKRDLSLSGIPDLRSSSRRHEPPRRDSLSASRSAYTTSRGIGEHRLARPSSVVSDYFSASRVSSFDHRSSLDREAAYFEPRVARNPSFSGNEEHQSRRASLAFFVPDPADDSAPSAVAFPCDGDLERAADETATEPSESDGEEEPLKSIQQPEFFVVNLEAAKRPKPEIGQRRTKATKEVSNADMPSSSATSSQQPPDASTKASSEKSKDVRGTSAEPENASSDVLVRSDDEKTESSSVGFVIEDSNFDPSISAEVEKKKNKLAELHQRRKEELAAKKNLISKDQQKKKEQLRLKEEKAQMKKSEEKQRRDLIFQKYLQRKSEMSETNSDDDSVKHFAVANSPHATASAKSSSRLKPPSHVNKKPRPQSQLVVGSVHREGNSDFSDDCSLIITAVKQPTVAQEPKVPTSPDPRGVTDGRKPAQEKLSRFLSCGSEGEKVEDGSGLKLFVKPNQKSNRSIIINAVKDCCLAGVVNQDLKGKVLEEINRSESKHFVVLFRDAGLQYRGLYSFNPEKQEVFKIHGVGPRQLSDKMMEKFFKYNSGSKNFSEVTSTKHLSSTIDGVTILSCLWSRKQPANTTPRKNTT